MNQHMKWATVLGLAMAAMHLSACAGLETQRKVYVNGEKLGAFGVAGMDQQTGQVLPDGRYWLEPVSGNWGIEGNNTPRGNVHAANTMASSNGGVAAMSGGSTSNSVNGTAGTGRDASGNHCAFVSLPNGESVMSCGK